MTDMRQMTLAGRDIENHSFTIIDNEVGPHSFDKEEWEVVRRVIHATADFEFKDLIRIHPQAIQSGIDALERGCSIITDVQMIISGLNQQRLETYGCLAQCFISDDDVIQNAKTNNTTRAIESMRKAANLNLLNGGIIAIGNAPTALLEVVQMIQTAAIRPALIIGVPVGFVSAAESKEAVLRLASQNYPDVSYILSVGRKGGSTIAVSIIHALLLLSQKRKEKCKSLLQ
jgi:precorrin-8X/cobalt-precorrin-8 methylmutase